MGLQIGGRLLSKVGITYMRNARMLATAAHRTRVQSKYQIINGFVLRAAGKGNLYNASVLDLPGYLFFGGSLSVQQLSAVGLAVPVGIRDDFDPPGTLAEFQVTGKSTYFLMPVPTRIRQAPQSFATDWFPLIQQQDWFLGYSRMDVPTLKEFPDLRAWYLDDETYFTYDTVVGLTGTITSLMTSARSLSFENGNVVIGETPANYFLRNQYALDEQDLPDDWKLYPRRLVPRADSAPAFSGRQYPGITLNGFAIAPASASAELEGVDLYCHAARTFRQHQEPWGDPGQRGFDRYGEQGMLIAKGAQDRSQYKPEVGNPVFAEAYQLQVVQPMDIEQAYLRPMPEKLPGDASGKPELPNFGIFYTPTPVQCGGDFAVFSAYTTYLDGGDGEGNAGDAWSLLTTLPGGSTVSVRADWNASDGEIETGVPGEFMQPWIVGAAAIPGDEGATAHCLVWEQTYVRAGKTRVKGEWALYSTSGGTPVRRTMTGGAPLFALLMADGPTTFDDSTFDTSNPMSAAYHAGNGLLVTAAIDYPAVSGSPIKCATIDVNSAEITIRGEIAPMTSAVDKCLITVVQPFLAEKDDRPARPAVLLATVTRNQVGNDGAGKTYLSVDGGDSWRIYVTDAGAQGGAFYSGNKLWRFNLNNWLDGRART